MQEKEEHGWITEPPLQKVLGFVRALRKSDRLYNAFESAAGRVVRAPVNTQWNSHLASFEDASALRSAYTQRVLEHSRQLSAFEMSAADWHVIEQTVTFLTAFRDITKACEGDSVTLDKVQVHMDFLSRHFKDESAQHANNALFNASIVTSWYAFDKYYKLIDQTSAYAAAILHPHCRKSYLQAVWHRD